MHELKKERKNVLFTVNFFSLFFFLKCNYFYMMLKTFNKHYFRNLTSKFQHNLKLLFHIKLRIQKKERKKKKHPNSVRHVHCLFEEWSGNSVEFRHFSPVGGLLWLRGENIIEFQWKGISLFDQ